MNVGRARQWYTAIASGFGTLVMALLSVWPSYTLPVYLSNSTTPLSTPITKMDESLLGSLPALGGMLGAGVAGPIFDMFGRRNGGLLVCLPFVISWAIITITKSINVILVARFVAGLAGGATMVLSPILVSEISEDSIRGALAANAMLQCCVGNLLSYIIGWIFSYTTILWLNLAFSVVCCLLIVLSVESPVYFLRKGREEDAKLSIARYRGVAVSSMIVLDELYRLKQQVLPANNMKSLLDSSKAEEAECEKLHEQENLPGKYKSVSSFKMLYSSPTSRKAFIMVISLLTLQVFIGLVAVQTYLSSVFYETDPDRTELYTVVFAIITIVGSLVSLVAVDRTGRRSLQILSSAVLCVCTVVLGVLLQFKVGPSWLVVLLIMAYCFFFMLGPGSVPWVLLAEIFVPEVLNLATMVIVEWVLSMNFVIIAIYPYLNEYFGLHGTFYTFAFISLINTVVSYYILPETTALSNEQIQKLFLPKKARI